MSDHIGESNGMTCVHCGLPFVREQNNILSFGCGSSFEDTFRPQWARSMTCLEIQNGQLQEMFRKANLHFLDLEDRIKRMEDAGNNLTRKMAPFMIETIVLDDETEVPITSVDTEMTIRREDEPTAGEIMALIDAIECWRAAKEAKP